MSWSRFFLKIAERLTSGSIGARMMQSSHHFIKFVSVDKSILATAGRALPPHFARRSLRRFLHSTEQPVRSDVISLIRAAAVSVSNQLRSCRHGSPRGMFGIQKNMQACLLSLVETWCRDDTRGSAQFGSMFMRILLRHITRLFELGFVQKRLNDCCRCYSTPRFCRDEEPLQMFAGT